MDTLIEGEEVNPWDRRWHQVLMKAFKVEVTPGAAKLIRACVIQRLHTLIPKCRSHQRHGKRKIMRGDDVLLALGVRTGRGLSKVGPIGNKPIKTATEPTITINNTVATHDEVMRYVLDTNCQQLNYNMPKDIQRIIGILAKVVRDNDAVDEHISRTITVFHCLFQHNSAKISDIYHVAMPILLSHRKIPASMRQRCARVITSVCDESAHDILANVLSTSLQQINGSSPSFEVVRGALWGLAHHPRRRPEFHENIALTLKRCFDHFTEKGDFLAVRDIIDALWMILRGEHNISLTWKVPVEKNNDRALAQGDSDPNRRKRQSKQRRMAKTLPPDAKKIKKDDDVVVQDPEIASQYLPGPISCIVEEMVPVEMLGRSDPFLRLTL